MGIGARAASYCRGSCTPGPHLWGQTSPLTSGIPILNPISLAGRKSSKQLQLSGLGRPPNLLCPHHSSQTCRTHS